MKKLFLLLLFPFLSLAQKDSIVVTKSKLSVIGLDRVNVVYRGVPNPISIAVNDAKSYKIIGDGVSQNEDGKYVIRPGSGTETKVFVAIEKNDGSKIIEEHVFRVKSGIPSPNGTINNIVCTFNNSVRFDILEIENAEVGIYFKDFLMIEGIVKQFNLKVQGYPTITITGNKLTSEAIDLIKKARKRDFIIITNIKANYYGVDYSCIKNPSIIVFRVNK